MISIRTLLGLAVLLASMLISESVEAEVCPEAYAMPLGMLRSTQPECYTAFMKEVARAEKEKKFVENAPLHVLLGEWQLTLQAAYSNEFDLPGLGAQAVLSSLESFYTVETGWVDKKIIRDIWAAADPRGYLASNSWVRDWFVDNLTLTVKGGWKRALTEALVDPVFVNRRTFTVGGGYTVKFDKASGKDID